MRNKRSKSIRKWVLQYFKDNRLDMRLFKGSYRRAKKEYNMGINGG